MAFMCFWVSCFSFGFNWLSVSRHSRSTNNLITSSLTFFSLPSHLAAICLTQFWKCFFTCHIESWVALVLETMFLSFCHLFCLLFSFSASFPFFVFSVCLSNWHFPFCLTFYLIFLYFFFMSHSLSTKNRSFILLRF